MVAVHDLVRDAALRLASAPEIAHAHAAAVRLPVRVPEQDPPEVFWSYADDPPMRTHRYRAQDFSDAAWSSPEKEAKVALYLGMLDELKTP